MIFSAIGSGSSDMKVQTILERLTGKAAPFADAVPPEVLRFFEDASGGFGYSQLNELLLLFGFDRITHAFFKFLLDGSTAYEAGDAFLSLDQLNDGVERFRKLAILRFGNVKFAFKSLSRDADNLESALANLDPLSQADFASRHTAILPISSIPADDAYLTGYLIERELKAKLRCNPEDQGAKELERRRLEVVASARRNHQAYLASDHLDVYVATSMREKHEFLSISRLTTQIFSHGAVSDLKLRWFDPTQAVCPDRIDKGLAEALMLKRATCTIYLAQESDTLGKDSELASTLAQGKPVVAYVPEVDDDYFEGHLKLVSSAYPDESITQVLIRQLRLFDPGAAWEDEEVRNWCRNLEKADISTMKQRLRQRIKNHYDGRASTLRDSHPLGVQVNLDSGVANGVLVVRNVPDCAKLIRRIVTRTLELELEETAKYTVLRETLSGCIFRVMTADAMLTNTFWNFYLDPVE